MQSEQHICMFHLKHTLQCFIFYAIASRTDEDSPFLEEPGKAKTPLLDPQNKINQCLVILHAQRSMLKEVAVMQKMWVFEMFRRVSLCLWKDLRGTTALGENRDHHIGGCHNSQHLAQEGWLSKLLSLSAETCEDHMDQEIIEALLELQGMGILRTSAAQPA